MHGINYTQILKAYLRHILICVPSYGAGPSGRAA